MLRRFFAYYRPWRRLFLLDFGCAVLSGVLELGFPLAVSGFVDHLLPGQDWKNNAKLPGEQAAVEKLLGSDGRVLIRPSGTEPLVRVMVEARSADMASNCAERLAEVVRAS